MTRTLVVLLLLLAMFSKGLNAQAPESLKTDEELKNVIASLDAALFDAYNRCDVAKFNSFFVEDVEMYHDDTGAMFGRDKLTTALEKNICGGDIVRELVSGTNEVYRMKGYGAVQIGIHRFLHPKSKTPPGEAKFIHLWNYKDGSWKITRVISFDHHAAGK